MLIESATTQGFPGEADLFVAQAVLQYVPLYFISFDFVRSLQCLMSIQCLEDSYFRGHSKSIDKLQCLVFFFVFLSEGSKMVAT